ncbi:hypothetical protein [Curtobacterium sp. MCBD17_019]|uniref:hypothetical protein n=1 Tax=Curtobacterium sp. MCBD17_019 TaxID=2175669 RepID=UPI0015E89F7C|nr:hypothetical protein [Curtobacterium sp. MCBD17_019]
MILSHPLAWFDGIDFADADVTRARIAAEFDGWAPELTALVTDSDTAPVLRSIHELPDRHRWVRVPGVTLLGDAAHVTVPGGEGANIAMFERSEAEAAAAHETVDLVFGTGAPHALASLFAGGDPVGDDVTQSR